MRNGTPWILVVLLLSSCTLASDKVVFALDTNEPPLAEVGLDGHLQGYSLDLISALTKKAGLPSSTVGCEWAQLFRGVREGRWDVAVATARVDARWQLDYDVTTSFFDAGPVLVVRREQRVVSIRDLKGQTVAVQKGSFAETVASRSLPLRTPALAYGELGRAFSDLVAGKVAAVLADGVLAARFVKRDPRFTNAFRIVGPPLESQPLVLVLKKGSRELMERLNGALTELRAEGELKTLEDLWLR